MLCKFNISIPKVTTLEINLFESTIVFSLKVCKTRCSYVCLDNFNNVLTNCCDIYLSF